MEKKICSKCNELKPLDRFNKDKRLNTYPDGRRNVCKECKYTPEVVERLREYGKEYNKKYRVENKEYYDEYNKKYQLENKEELLLKKKEYYESNKEHFREYYHDNKDRLIDVRKKWREDNKEHLREYKNKYQKDRKKKDSLYKLKTSIRSLISHSIKKGFTEKSKKTKDILGCSFEEFKIYLESQFNEYMTWENHGTYWHLDHKIPASWANDEKHLYELNHYTNFQPLFWLDNLIKGNRYST